MRSPGTQSAQLRRVAALMAAGLAGAAVTAAVFATASQHAAVRRVPARLEQTVIASIGELQSGLAFSPDGMLVAVTGFRSTEVINLVTGERTMFRQHASGGFVNDAAFSPDGRTLVVTADANNHAAVLRWSLPAGTPGPSLPYPRLSGFSQVAYGADGEILAAQNDAHGRYGTSTYLWTADTGRVIKVISYPDGGNSPIAFSPDGTTLAVADEWAGNRGIGDGKIHLWNVATRRNQATLTDPGRGGVDAMAYSPDGATLAVTDGSDIYLWNTARRTLTGVLQGPRREALLSLAFSPDDRSLAAAGTGHSAYVWDTATGKLAAIFPDPSGNQTSSLAYSPDGRTLAVLDTFGRIYLWNVASLH